MEEIPSPFAESEKFFPLLGAAHAGFPVCGPFPFALVLASDSESCTLGFRSVERAWRAAVVALVFVAAASSAGG